MFQKAIRKRAKARIGICGPAGSGKTMSVLKLAFGIVGPTGKIAVIDTEKSVLFALTIFGMCQAVMLPKSYAKTVEEKLSA